MAVLSTTRPRCTKKQKMLFPGPVAGNTAFDSVESTVSPAGQWEGFETISVLQEGNSLTVGSANRFLYFKNLFDVFLVFEIPAGTYTPSEFAATIQSVTGRTCTWELET